MAKKNYVKYIPKVGGTVAVAVAMTMALSTQASATELDEADLLNTGIPPVEENNPETELNIDGMEPAEANAAVDEANQEILDENQETLGENEQTQLENQEAVEKNEELTDGQLPDPELELTDAPETPNTDGMNVEDHNEAVGEYNEKVDGYNDAANEYNDKVDDYNVAADAYDQQAREDYLNSAEYQQYLADKAAWEAQEKAYQDYMANNEDYQNSAEYQQYLSDKAAWEAQEKAYQDSITAQEEFLNSQEYKDYLQEKADWEAKDKAYQDYLANNEDYQNSAEYQQYLADKAAWEAKDKAYQDSIAAQEEFLNSQEYKDYLNEKAEWEAKDKAYQDYLANNEDYQNSAEYQQYLADKAAWDILNKAYQDSLAAVENFPDSQEYKDYLAAKEEWEAKEKAYQDYLDNNEDYQSSQEYQDYLEDKNVYDQLVEENQIYGDVTEYNGQIESKNEDIAGKNEALENDLHAEAVANIDAVGDINDNVEVSDDVMNVLNSYDELAKQHDALMAQAEALEAHEGKTADLGSDAYAAYLAAVEAYNEAVEDFNVSAAAYNAAVEAYNAAVDTYNQNKPADSSSSTGSGTTQGSASIDWGNVDIGSDTVGHVDVKYQAAASKDVTYEDGEPSYSEKVTQYEVTGVYTDEATANGGNSTDYGLVYDNDGSGDQTPGTQDLEKDSSYNEFGSHHGQDNATYEEVETLDTSKTYYIVSGRDYVEIEYKDGEWQTTGRKPTSINVDNYTVYDKKEVAINPATGTVSFHVTLKDSNGDSHGIDVNLNAGSVYAAGSYYKAKYDYWGNETDFLHQFYTVDEEGNKHYIPVEWIENEDGVKEKYYNISGQSVFLISALTCDGMREGKNGTLNPDGLDLILNLQTMIEIHKGDNAQKVSFVNYELGKTAQADAPDAPGTEPTPPVVQKPGDAPETEFPTVEPNPGPAPGAPVVQKPGNAPSIDIPGLEPEPGPAPGAPVVQKPGNAPSIDIPGLEPEPGPAPGAPVVQKPGDAPSIDIPGLEPEPGPAPGAPVVQEPGNAPTAPTAPTPVHRLEHVGKLDYLHEKVEIVVPPAPQPDPGPGPNPNPQPVVFNDDGLVIINDGPVPLADVPKTGDASVVFGAMSAFSGFGLAFMQLFGRKKKEEN